MNRSAMSLAAVLLVGCASPVYRLEGEPLTPAGPPRSSCESKDWLVIAPTRVDVVSSKTGFAKPKTGVGLYRVGAADPESIPDVDLLPESDSVSRKRDELDRYRRRQYIAGGLGAAALTAIAVGTIVFVNAFETSVTYGPNGERHEDNTVNGGRAGLGGALVGVGFGLGIGGLVVNPSHAERTSLASDQYVFLDPPDSKGSVETMTLYHNNAVRQRCATSPAAP